MSQEAERRQLADTQLVMMALAALLPIDSELHRLLKERAMEIATELFQKRKEATG